MFKSILRFVGIFVFMGALAATNSFATTYYGYQNYGPFNCPDSSDYDNDNGAFVMPTTCNGYTFTCPSYSYKVYNSDSSDTQNYRHFFCLRCPKISNADSWSLGQYNGEALPGSSANTSQLTWLSGYRCRAVDRTASSHGAGTPEPYRYKNTIKPKANCSDNYHRLSNSAEPVDYIGEGINTSAAENTGCEYELVSRQYTMVQAGKYAANNNSVNATVKDCPDGTYKTNTYAPQSYCYHCPIDMHDHPSDPSYWDFGTTSVLGGATSVNNCYYSGSTNLSDSSGSYTNQGTCSYNGSYTHYGMFCVCGDSNIFSGNQSDTCNAAILDYAHYLGYTSDYGGDVQKAQEIKNSGGLFYPRSCSGANYMNTLCTDFDEAIEMMTYMGPGCNLVLLTDQNS